RHAPIEEDSPMRPNLSARTLLAAAVAVAALAGCRREEPDPVVPPPTATQPARPLPPPVLAPAPSAAPLPLGNAIGDDNRIATPVSAFSSGDPIHASGETDGEARRLPARWTRRDSDQVVAEEQKDV